MPCVVCRPHASPPSFQPIRSGGKPQLTFDKATCNLSHSPKPVTYTTLLLATAAHPNALSLAANFQKSLPTDPTADGKNAGGAKDPVPSKRSRASARAGYLSRTASERSSAVRANGAARDSVNGCCHFRTLSVAANGTAAALVSHSIIHARDCLLVSAGAQTTQQTNDKAIQSSRFFVKKHTRRCRPLRLGLQLQQLHSLTGNSTEFPFGTITLGLGF